MLYSNACFKASYYYFLKIKINSNGELNIIGLISKKLHMVGLIEWSIIQFCAIITNINMIV